MLSWFLSSLPAILVSHYNDRLSLIAPSVIAISLQQLQSGNLCYSSKSVLIQSFETPFVRYVIDSDMH